MQLLMFYLFGFLSVFAAVAMIVSKQPVMSALCLIFNMLCLAGLFVLLDAHLIAALQVMVYAGAIMVLVLFVIMMLNLREKRGLITKHKVALQAIGIIFISYILTIAVAGINLTKVPVVKMASDEFGTVAGVARVLFTEFLLPFEIASVLLLAAIVGAVILSKSKV